MRFAFYSVEGTSLSLWARVQDEGHDVLVYIKPEAQKRNGDGIVPKTHNLAHWRAWGAQDNATVYVFDGSGAGELADELRRSGKLVIGGGGFMDKLEKGRVAAYELATRLGIKVAPYKSFSTISAAIAAAKTLDKPHVFKTEKYLESGATFVSDHPDEMVRYLHGIRARFGDKNPCVLQLKIPGVALSTAAWWNGHAFLVGFEGTIEHKKFLDGDLGPNTGCSFNAVWMYEDAIPRISTALHWGAYEAYMRAKQAPPGLYDINALIAEEDGEWGAAGEAFFLEFTPRFGYDSEPTMQRLLTMDLAEFYYKLATAQVEAAPFEVRRLAYSVRLSVPPYAWEHVDQCSGKETCVGTPIMGADGLWDGHFIGYGVRETPQGEFEVSDPTGLVGLSLVAGTHIPTLDRLAQKYAKDELRIPQRQFRTDGGAVVVEDAKRLAKLGYSTPIKD